jgi:hypothetical protein
MIETGAPAASGYVDRSQPQANVVWLAAAVTVAIRSIAG